MGSGRQHHLQVLAALYNLSLLTQQHGTCQVSAVLPSMVVSPSDIRIAKQQHHLQWLPRPRQLWTLVTDAFIKKVRPTCRSTLASRAFSKRLSKMRIFGSA